MMKATRLTGMEQITIFVLTFVIGAILFTLFGMFMLTVIEWSSMGFSTGFQDVLATMDITVTTRRIVFAMAACAAVVLAALILAASRKSNPPQDERPSFLYDDWDDYDEFSMR